METGGSSPLFPVFIKHNFMSIAVTKIYNRNVKSTGQVEAVEFKTTTGLVDTNGNEVIKVSATSAAVNELTVANAAAGNDVVLSTTGSDTNINLQLAPKGSGTVFINGAEKVSQVSQVGAGALPLIYSTVVLTTTGANALTLANGVTGQRLNIIMLTDGGDGTLTPSSRLGFSTITFNDVGDCVVLEFVDFGVLGTGWAIIGSRGVTIA